MAAAAKPLRYVINSTEDMRLLAARYWQTDGTEEVERSCEGKGGTYTISETRAKYLSHSRIASLLGYKNARAVRRLLQRARDKIAKAILEDLENASKETDTGE